MEVVEHVDPARLEALARVVFGAARRRRLVTTPNGEYNTRYEGLDGMRHPDHRFEWDRDEFPAWTTGVAVDIRLRGEPHGIGEVDDLIGPPPRWRCSPVTG